MEQYVVWIIWSYSTLQIAQYNSGLTFQLNGQQT